MQQRGFLNKIKSIFTLDDAKNEKIKISVIVPTYNTDPEALARLMASIDAQTMDKSEYEIIIVDDGSTTDIFKTLTKMAKKRSNMIVKQIPNSGWGSRPRNIGTKMASGDYILYLDHDDTVFPEAFERVYEYGIANNADVVNAKEVRTKGWSWGWDQFKENNPHAEKLGIESLLPMTPHKFYRREFLLEHEIEFNEGARVLWEDVYFNTKVFACGAKVAILADYPAYYWIATGANNSSSFGRDPHEKWDQIRRLITFFTQTITKKDDLDFMLKHWYQSRVLGILGPWLLNKSEERITVEFEYAKKVAEDLIPAYIDDTLTGINKVRAYLLRNNKVEELKRIAKLDEKITARPYATNVEWKDGKLFIAATTELTIDEKKPYTLEEKGTKTYRKLPVEIKDSLPPQLLDLTEDMKGNKFEASIKDRNTRVTWETPVITSVTNKKPAGESAISLTGKMEFAIDIEKAAMGIPLVNNPWDIAARFTAIGMAFHRGIVGESGFIKAALIDGRTSVVYTNKSNLLTLDIGSKVHSVVSAAKPNKEDIKIEANDGKRVDVIIELPNVHTYGNTNIKGHIEFKKIGEDSSVWKELAYLIGDENGARVTVANVKLLPGKYSVSTIFEGRRANPELLYFEYGLLGV